MNPIEQIIANSGVVNFSAAAAMVLSVPNDVTAVDAALLPYITDGVLRASCASRIVTQRNQPVVQQIAQPVVGQALVQVQIPAAPALQWANQQPNANQNQQNPAATVSPQSLRTHWTTWMIIGLLSVLVGFAIYWIFHGAEEQTATTFVAVKVETDAIKAKADAIKTETDKIQPLAIAGKVETDAIKAKVDDIKLVADATSLKVDALKADLTAARRALRYAIATRATPADIAAAEGRLTAALKATKITVQVK